MEEHVGSFEAVGDDGEEYTVDMFVKVIEAGARGNHNRVVSKLKHLRTSDGDDVSPTGPGEYLVIQTGVILRSDSPNAP